MNVIIKSWKGGGDMRWKLDRGYWTVDSAAKGSGADGSIAQYYISLYLGWEI